MEVKELYKKAIDRWGEPLQMMMAIEEMAELTMELCRRFRSRSAPEDMTIVELNKSASITKSHCKRMREVWKRYPDIFTVVPINDGPVIEELGDVEIMTGQLRVMLGKDDYVDKQIERKLRRLEAMFGE